MFERLRLKLARRHDAKRVARLFSSIDRSILRKEVEDWIGQGEVFVLKERKKVRGAFSFTVWGILGIFGFLYIRKLAVEEGLRGRGLGSFLLAQIKQLSLKAQATAFFLFSLDKAIGFYQKNRLEGLGRLFWWRKKDQASIEGIGKKSIE